jgi:hypothetical protein
MTFLNGDLYENVYMAQPKGFIVEGKENMGCRLKKSIYVLKQASRQWYLKFDETTKKFGFKEKSLRTKNSFSLFCMWMTFYLQVVI